MEKEKIEKMATAFLDAWIKNDEWGLKKLSVSADVTSNCEYSSSRPEVVTVNDGGLIIGVRPSPFGALMEEATILVTYTQHNFWTGKIIRTAEVEVKVLY